MENFESSYAAGQPADPPPPYEGPADQTTSNKDDIPDGRWDLACSIDDQHRLLQLNAEGQPTWLEDAAADGRGYRRHGFNILPSPREIKVANQVHEWACDAHTTAGRLLISRGDNVSLRSAGRILVVFEHTVVSEDRSKPRPAPRPDPRGCLRVESQSPDIWVVSGTDIYQVEVDGNDLVVLSPIYLRLWDMVKNRLRWERDGMGRIQGLTKDYVVTDGRWWHLRSRKNGNHYGDFMFPSFQAFTDLNKKNHFGPVVSTGGLFLYKPCQKALCIFRVGPESVDFRFWESTDIIRGSLVLRGELENLELELLGQKPSWTEHKVTEQIFVNNWLKKRVS